MSTLLPWVQKEAEKIKKLNLSLNEKLNLLFNKIPGICRFKAEQLTDEQRKSFAQTFGLKSSILNKPLIKLNRRKYK